MEGGYSSVQTDDSIEAGERSQGGGVWHCSYSSMQTDDSIEAGNHGKVVYRTCEYSSVEADDPIEAWLPPVKKEYVEALSVAIDANLEGQRKWVREETNRVNRRVAFLKEQNDAIIQRCIRGMIPDAMAKEQLEKAAAEEKGLKCQLALVAESALDTPEVLKRGLEILGDLGSFWEKSNLSTRQQLQRFVFPEDVTARKSGFGTSRIALCLRAEELPSPVITSVVGPPGFEPRTKWL
jgi:hypothetical protein